MTSYMLNTAQVKKMNIQLVKSTLKAQGVATKASIAGITQLSVATCGTILNELLARGEVMELEADGSSGGRPAKQYKYNADFGCIICFLVKTEGGIHSVSYSIVNLLGEIKTGKTLALRHIDTEVIDQLLDDLICNNENVQAIGIGIPGVVHRGTIGVCDVPELAGQPLGSYLEGKYDIPIKIENDMNMTVYGFYHLQNFDEDKTIAIVTFPQNHFPGAGFMIDGRLLSGNTTFAGEVSFLPFDISREEQLRQLQTKEGLIQLVTKTLSSIIAIINPVIIAMTGEMLRESYLEQLYRGCLKDIPEEHMPQLVVRHNMHQEYMAGLITATLECLTYRMQVHTK